MNASQIEEALRGRLGSKISFLGCFWMKDFPLLLKRARVHNKPCVIILNTLSPNDTEMDMGHWIALYVNYGGCTMVYFDSYNIRPQIYSKELHIFLQKNPSLTVYTLKYGLQSANSLVCGIYTMYFTYLLSYHTVNMTLSIFHKKFKKCQYYTNDRLILRLGYSIFNMPPCEKVFCLPKNMKLCKRSTCGHLAD